MTKAQEIAFSAMSLFRIGAASVNAHAEIVAECAVKEALEWAARQVEGWQDCDCGHGVKPDQYTYNTGSGHALNCHFYAAELIRAGKSQ